MIGSHERRTDQGHVIAETNNRAYVFNRVHSALCNVAVAGRHSISELEATELDGEFLEIATIESDQNPLLMLLSGSKDFACDREISRIKRFEQYKHFQNRGAIEQLGDATAIEHPHDHQHTACALGPGLHHLIRIDEKILTHGRNIERPQQL